MRVRVLSDLHLEFADFVPAPLDCDVVVLAGDIHQGTAGMPWARRHFPGLPIVYVPGNHEYYGHDWDRLADDMQRVARAHDIHLLDRGIVTLGDVRVLGCTLWTDFDLFGTERRADSMNAVGRALFDYRYILTAGRRIVPEETRERHLRDRAWLDAQLAPAGVAAWRATLVVTHMVPSQRSTAERFRDLPVSAGFASHLDALVARADAWIHGHTHDSYDYRLESCRVVCNPRGYRRTKHARDVFENNAFNERLVIEV
jgi:predicted phosphodiesterase